MRTTIPEVREIIDTTLSDEAVATYINIAYSIINANLLASSIARSTLIEIERNLTAHLIRASKESLTSQEKSGEVSITYARVYTEELKYTSFGQIVLSLDPTGTLAEEKASTTITIIKSFE
jgi:hypothetical protein